MSIGTGAVYSLLGICVVFAALALLMAVVVILYRLTTPKTARNVTNLSRPARSNGYMSPAR